jgi:hypothetical protein
MDSIFSDLWLRCNPRQARTPVMLCCRTLDSIFSDLWLRCDPSQARTPVMLCFRTRLCLHECDRLTLIPQTGQALANAAQEHSNMNITTSNEQECIGRPLEANFKATSFISHASVQSPH